jgi:HNH endonuclease
MLKKLKPIEICSYCLRVGSSSSDPDGDKWHADHVIPKTKYAGSSKDLFNLVKSCAKCNLFKKDKLGIMPRYGSLYADGTVHNKEKEDQLMLRMRSDYEVLLEAKDATDISITQAVIEYDVSIDTVRRAIHNKQIEGVYKIKKHQTLKYFFPRSSADKLWLNKKNNDAWTDSTEVDSLKKEIIRLKKIINAIVDLGEK